MKKHIFLVLLLPIVLLTALPMRATELSESPTYSGTLPVLYISTNDGKDIVSKETYVDATYYLDNMHIEGYKSIGSKESPLPLQIRGRGNYTWRDFDKKPYRLKLGDKQALMGMTKSKHWALMAGADDELAFLRNTVGYMLSKKLGLRWTPSQEAVELVLNGKYWGLYFLTETIRVDNHRVSIQEQQDEITHPDSISGGWLVEIDNYSSEGNVEIEEGNGKTIMFTMHTPEILSNEQRGYITQQLNNLNSAIYSYDSKDLIQLMDIREAAKYYVVQEILEDCESYHGSCYLYKDIDSTFSPCKWMFGPVWDFGNAYRRRSDKFIYDKPIWTQYWIGQIATHAIFQQNVLEVWYDFYRQGQYEIRGQIETFISHIASAAKSDEARWKGAHNVCTSGKAQTKKTEFLNYFSWRINWLYTQWGTGKKPTEIESVEVPNNEKRTIIQSGRLVIDVPPYRYSATGQRL